MSIKCVNQCLRIVSYIGRGTDGDPCRTVVTYVDLSGQVLDVVDEYVNSERLRMAGGGAVIEDSGAGSPIRF